MGVGNDRHGLTNNPAKALNSSIAKLTEKDINKNPTAAAGELELYHYVQNRDKDIEAMVQQTGCKFTQTINS